MGLRVLVTGGAGFIGSAVVAELVRRGHEPVVLDSLRPDVHGPEAPGLRPDVHGPGLPGHRRGLADGFVRADLRDRDAVAAAVAGVDAVAHLAGKVGLGVDLGDLDDYVASNDLGTAVLLQAMARAGVPRLVLASSMVVYGEGAYSCPEHGPVAPGPRRPEELAAGRFEPPCPLCAQPLAPGLVGEDAPADPRNGYAATKLHQEHLSAVWARETGSSVAALRFHNVYGAGMPRDTPYAGVAAIFRSALENGKAPTVLEDGAQRRDFVEVTDVARAVVTAVAGDTNWPFRAYNIGSGRVATIGELAVLLAAALGGPSPVVTGGYRLGDVRHVTASSARAAAELGWRAQVPLAAGITSFATSPLRPAIPTLESDYPSAATISPPR